jgi:hypothetical protein
MTGKVHRPLFRVIERVIVPSFAGRGKLYIACAAGNLPEVDR